LGAETVKVAILMGSEKDADKMEPAREVLEGLGITSEVHVMSAHRTPDKVAAFATAARDSGYVAIICGAGKAAHLAGAVAAHTTLPVIGVPIAAGSLGGLDALLATVQMPTGIPVATVAVDGAANAGYLAAALISVSDEGVAAALEKYRESLQA
jgi:5-(carboxyamino)imidazole ribonucleotide mutase